MWTRWPAPSWWTTTPRGKYHPVTVIDRYKKQCCCNVEWLVPTTQEVWLGAVKATWGSWQWHHSQPQSGQDRWCVFIEQLVPQRGRLQAAGSSACKVESLYCYFSEGMQVFFVLGFFCLFFFQSVLLKLVSVSTKVKLHFCFLSNCQSATADACFVITAQSVETSRTKGRPILPEAQCVLNEMLWLSLSNTVSSFVGCCIGMGTET